MILIISNSRDLTTNKVIQWILHFNREFIRINELDVISLIELEINSSNVDFTFKVKNKLIKYSEIESVWYRRGGIKLSPIISMSKKSIFNNRRIKEYFNYEINEIREFIINALSLKTHINSEKHYHLNKLSVLLKASQLKIDIPYTIISTSDYKLNPNTKYITKSIRDGSYFSNSKGTYYMTTINYQPKNRNNYFPSLFQNKIVKSYEIRSFYLNGHFFSMAIFSQSNKMTETDYRNYDLDNPNRIVPYKLNKQLENKLILLLENLELNSGSIDLIKSKDGKYYFLEVNPVGQFGQLSYNCNYNIEKIIAKSLCI